MKLFKCQACGQPLYFEAFHCQSCERRLGFLPSSKHVVALDRHDENWVPFGAPGRSLRFCANSEYDVCNWLIPADSSDRYCVACSHNRVIPTLSHTTNVERWKRLEQAKHRLFYTLLKLDLPLSRRPEDSQGLHFDFLSDPNEGTLDPPTVLTGHDNGLITINIAEADDVERERRRWAMREPYRTLLGHFRHEVGHYYWTMLVERDGSSLERFRTVFGDERKDYGEALRVYYAEGAPATWQDQYISAYASAHPWEDWAETWAHYLHIVDTLDTAYGFGLKTEPLLARGAEFASAVDFDPHLVAELEPIITAWLPLTFALNSLNRSMGQPDLYPFVLAPAVIGKLAFVHARVHRSEGRVQDEEASETVLRAVIAGLRSRTAAPH